MSHPLTPPRVVTRIMVLRASGLNYREIAEAVGMSTSGVQKVVARSQGDKEWQPKPLLPHGTLAARQRHYKAGERPCLACADAGAADRRERNRERLSREWPAGTLIETRTKEKWHGSVIGVRAPTDESGDYRGGPLRIAVRGTSGSREIRYLLPWVLKKR